MNDNNENINTNESTEIDTACKSVISQVESFTKPIFLEENTTSSKPLVAKIPVVLADINIMFNLEANITLDRLAREITRIKKNVFLTESRIIPFSKDNDEPNAGILFIKGFIRNNIEYIPQRYNIPLSKNVYGNIRYCIVETPFELNTKVTFIREPIFNKKSNEDELDFSTYKISYNNPLKTTGAVLPSWLWLWLLSRFHQYNLPQPNPVRPSSAQVFLCLSNESYRCSFRRNLRLGSWI